VGTSGYLMMSPPDNFISAVTGEWWDLRDQITSKRPLLLLTAPSVGVALPRARVLDRQVKRIADTSLGPYDRRGAGVGFQLAAQP